MRNSFFFLLAAAAMAQPNTGRELGSGMATLESGVTLRHKTMVEPRVTKSAFLIPGETYGAAGNSWNHAIYDRTAKSYFGYEMSVLPGSDPATRRVVFGPVNFARVERGLKAVAGDLPLAAAPPPLFPPPQIVHNDDTIAMELASSPDGREHIVDYIHFAFGVAPKTAPAVTAAPQDFTLDDGPLSFDLNPPEVLIDGQKSKNFVITYNSPGGATLWYYFPGQGRYLLSLVPHEGFTKSGVLRANVVTFSADGHDYEIRLADPVAGTEKAWNLYVMHDASYLPRPAVSKWIVGSWGRLEDLLPKK